MPPTATVDAQRSVDTRVLGSLLFTFGNLWLLKETGLVDVSWQTVLAVVLLGLGILMILTARTAGSSMRLALVGVALTLGLTSMSSIENLPDGGVGDKVVHPTSVRLIKPKYNLLAGSLTLDLQDVSIGKDTRVAAEVGVGELVVIVPSDVVVEVQSHIDGGELTLFGQTVSSGTDVTEDRSFTPAGAAEGGPRLLLDLEVGLGTIDVVRSERFADA